MLNILENKLIENNFTTKIAETRLALYIYIYIYIVYCILNNKKVNIKNKDSTMSIFNRIDVDIGLSFVACKR